jgi:uncharacterized damage-inducible protein DinB
MSQALVELLRGHGAHADPLASIEDVDADLANRCVENFPHSIAALVFHMNYWMNYELRRMRGEKPSYPEHNAESFPCSGCAPELWERMKGDLAGLLGDLRQVAESGRRQLDRQLESVDAGGTPPANSLESVLWQLVAHNSYHTGQIAMIRRAVNAWPPQAGGDTW